MFQESIDLVLYLGAILGLAMGVYQAFLGYTISLCSILLLLVVLENKDSLKGIITQAVRYLLLVLLGTVAYFTFMKLSLITQNVVLSSYQGIDQIGIINFNILLQLISKAYVNLLSFFVRDAFINNNFVVEILYIAVFVLMGVFILNLVIVNKIYKDKLKLILLIFLIILLPLCINSIVIMAPNSWIHVLMIMSFVHVFILLIGLADMNFNFAMTPLKRVSIGGAPLYLRNLFVIMCIYSTFIISTSLIYNYYILDHQIYLRLEMQYENSYAFVNRLVSRIESTEGYQPKNPVAIIGKVPSLVTKSQFNELNSLGVIFNDDLQIIQARDCLERFINDWAGVKLVFAKPEQKKEISHSAEFKNMPPYPLKGSIRVIDNVTVVKLGER